MVGGHDSAKDGRVLVLTNLKIDLPNKVLLNCMLHSQSHTASSRLCLVLGTSMIIRNLCHKGLLDARSATFRTRARKREKKDIDNRQGS
jgi:hypothetical protein